MNEIAVRKSQLIVDKIWHEGGPPLKEPRLRGAILTVIKNPFAGRYVEDIQPFMKPLEHLGIGMARELAERWAGRRRCRATARRRWSGSPANWSMAPCGTRRAAIRCARCWAAPRRSCRRPRRSGRPGRASTCRCTTSTPPMCAATSTPSRSASTMRRGRTRSSTSWPWAPVPRVHDRAGGLKASEIKGEDGQR